MFLLPVEHIDIYASSLELDYIWLEMPLPNVSFINIWNTSTISVHIYMFQGIVIKQLFYIHLYCDKFIY